MKKSLAYKREALAEAYWNEQQEQGELNSRHMDTIDQAWLKGFDACAAELLPRIEKLVEALERQSHPHVEQFCKERALNALAEWRKFKGEV